jgi:uncharacterized small protein (DUF1192 family)
MTGNTHFVFRHRVFSVDGSYFSSRKGGRDPCLNVPMGEITATIAIPVLRKEFTIPDGSEDGRLLDVVERALQYLRLIRVNDSIPSELLDGSASWSLQDRHRDAARCRLALNLVSWATGKSPRASDLGEFVKEIERADVGTAVRGAMRKAAQALGESEDAVGEVERRIAHLQHELAYIEGLRERFQAIRGVMEIVDRAAAARGLGHLVKDDFERVRVLLSHAFTKIGSEFDLVDRQHEDLLSALSDMAAQVQLVRDVRDEIHYEMMMWDEVVEQWRAVARKRSDVGIARVLETTYHFLAQNYATVQVW